MSSIPGGIVGLTRMLADLMIGMKYSNDIEIRTMSEWALRLAKDIGHQVQLMTLARIGGERGTRACLPWHYTEFEIPKYTEAYSKLPMTKDITTISTREDVASLAAVRGSSTVQAFSSSRIRHPCGIQGFWRALDS